MKTAAPSPTPSDAAGAGKSTGSNGATPAPVSDAAARNSVQRAAPDSPQPGARPVPVVIYLIDTLRADRLGAYGNSGRLTPHLDELARGGVVFEHACAAAPWTLPSVASLLTSTFAPEHGLLEVGHALADGIRPLGQRLAALGYRCAAWSANSFAKKVADEPFGYALSKLTPKRYNVDEVEAWLEQAPAGPVHLYLHTTEPHNPFNAPADWLARFGSITAADCNDINNAMQAYRRLTKVDFQNGRPPGTTDNTPEQERAMRRLEALSPSLRSVYDAHVAWADDHLGRLVAMLQRRGLWEDCLFIALSDHGEEFGEHGGWQHDQSLYDELLHVPLIIKLPRGESAGRRIPDTVSLVDVMPTILDVIGGASEAASCRGRSLLPLMRGGGAAGTSPSADGPRVVAVRINQTKYYRPFRERRGDYNIAVRDGRWKAILNIETRPQSLEMFDLERDPGELDNAAARESDRAGQLAAFARAWLKENDRSVTGRKTAPLTEQERRNLEKLGYLDGPPPSTAPARPPRKDAEPKSEPRP